MVFDSKAGRGKGIVKRYSILLAFTLVLAGAEREPSRSSTGRIFFLDIKGGRVVSANPDGTDLKVLVDGRRQIPDGIVVDTAAQHIYWTNMGKPKKEDGTVERVNLDGSNLTTVVPMGGAFTPKQLKIDQKHGKLYWSDREGMRVMRSNLDGSRIEVLVETGHGDEDRLDARNWCVGIAVDAEGGKVYWTQKGGDNAGVGSIRRANLEVPKGQDPAHRSDIEVLFDGLPEPIDMDLDVAHSMMYWTDRGDPPRGNTVSRAPMDPPRGADPRNRSDQEILFGGLHEGIGISLDLKGGRMFVTDLGGNVYSSKLDGSDKKVVLTGQGALTGIAYADLP
jgi:DNA-binding beta-propeller fold protein YncE